MKLCLGYEAERGGSGPEREQLSREDGPRCVAHWEVGKPEDRRGFKMGNVHSFGGE